MSRDVRDPAFVQDPWETYRTLHAAGGAAYWQELGMRCFAGYEAVDRLLRDRRMVRTDPDPPPSGGRGHLAWFDRVERHSLLNLEPPEHTRLRMQVNRAFVTSRIQALAPMLAREADLLLDALAGVRGFDLLESFATPLPLRVIAALMGVPRGLEPAMRRWSQAMVRLYMPDPRPEEEAAADAACRDFHAALVDLIRHKRRLPPADLLGDLAHGPLTEDEIVSTAVLVLNAGHEATVHQIGNAVLTLLTDAPDAWRALAAGAPADAIVEESLRFRAPLHLFIRHATEDIDLGGGLALRTGERAGLLLGAANRDPAAFFEPDRFWPDRPDQRHVSFGAGVHFCVGAPLARMELRIGLERLARRFPHLAITGTPRFADTWHFHGLAALEVLPSGDGAGSGGSA
jgi:unspecific monooxygenase